MNLNRIESYFRANEKLKKKLNESTALAQRLKEELDFSHNVEKKERQQLLRAQDRNIILLREINALKPLQGQAREQQQQIKTLEENFLKLQEIIEGLKATVSKKIAEVKNAEALEKKVAEMEEQIKERDGRLSAMQMDYKIQMKEKDQKVNELTEKLAEVKAECEKTKLDYEIMKNDVDRVHLTYSKQIMDLDITIKQYEKERREILDTSGVVHQSTGIQRQELKIIPVAWDKNRNVTWADAARKAAAIKPRMTSDREPGFDTQTDKRPKFRPMTKTNAAVIKPVVVGGAPKLDVKTVRDDGQPQPKKKKLFSNNIDDFSF